MKKMGAYPSSGFLRSALWFLFMGAAAGAARWTTLESSGSVISICNITGGYFELLDESICLSQDIVEFSRKQLEEGNLAFVEFETNEPPLMTLKPEALKDTVEIRPVITFFSDVYRQEKDHPQRSSALESSGSPAP